MPEPTRNDSAANVSVATRIGRRLGSLVATGIAIAVGYVWAKHGVLIALALYGGSIVIVFALYGVMTYDWKSK